MEGWQLAIVLKPFGLLALFACLVIPVELGLKRLWPDGRLKSVLFDRTFRARHPWYFMGVWTVLMVSLWTWIYMAFLRGVIG